MSITLNGTTGLAGTNGSAGTPAVQGEDTNTGIFFPAADTVGVATAGTERVRVDSSGNLGLGTSDPTTLGGGSKFVVNQGADGNIVFARGGSVRQVQLGTSSTMGYINADNTSGGLGFNVNTTERMRIDASGNIGLGVTPSAWGSFTAMQFGDTGCLASNAFSSSNTQTFFGNNVYYDGAYKYISTGSAAAQYIQIGAEHRWNIAPSGTAGNAITFTQAMTLDSSGNLLVNRTGPDGSAVFQVATKNNYGIGVASGVTTTQYVLEFRNGNGVVGTVTTSGTTTAYNTSSDYRLKENVQPMTGALDTITQLKPVTYTWKADGSAGQGFIAHELQAVVPDCVTGEKDAVDAEGNPQYQGVDTSFLVATLVKAIQELTARIAILEAK